MPGVKAILSADDVAARPIISRQRDSHQDQQAGRTSAGVKEFQAGHHGLFHLVMHLVNLDVEVLFRGCFRAVLSRSEQSSQSHYDKLRWISHFPLPGTRLVSFTWQAARIGIPT